MNTSSPNTLNISTAELAELLDVKIEPRAGAQIITGFTSLRDAKSGDLSFLSSSRYRAQLAATRASVVLVPQGWSDVPAGVIALPVANPSNSFQKVVDRYSQPPTPLRGGIHKTAFLAEGVQVDASKVSIGANAVIEVGASLGDFVEIGSGCHVGAGVQIGSGSRLFPNVTVLEGCIIGRNVILHSGVVIGGDGFGYEFVNGRHQKIRQAGIVQIDDDVEIGANTTVDRARFGRTWIGEGTKIDNQVQIAHNVCIGKHCIVISGVGIAGSAQIGDYVVIAAQAGIAGHISIGSRCTIAGRAGVTKDLPADSGVYMGFPAVPASEERRRLVASRKVPDLIERIKKLEKASEASSE